MAADIVDRLRDFKRALQAAPEITGILESVHQQGAVFLVIRVPGSQAAVEAVRRVYAEIARCDLKLGWLHIRHDDWPDQPPRTWDIP